MEKFIILLLMMVCLFGPMSIFLFVGNKALVDLGKRPSEGSRVMIPFLLKLLGATAVSIILLMVLLKFFVPPDTGELDFRFRDDQWRTERMCDMLYD